jgi:phage repressor protein C with HTH and peptisase S24 domain
MEVMSAMENSPDAIAGALKALRERAKLSMASLATELEFRGASSYQRYETPSLLKRGYLHRDLVAKLETAFVGRGNPPITREEVWALAGPEFVSAPAMDEEVERTSGRRIPTVAGEPTYKRDFPIYPATMGGSGHVLITFDPLEYVERPAMLQHVSDAYGVLVVGESMVPAFRPGDVAWVNPRLPPMRDTDVVLFHEPPSGESECMIKQLNNWNGQDWVLEQFNPPKEFTASRAEWRTCHRVVGKQSRR